MSTLNGLRYAGLASLFVFVVSGSPKAAKASDPLVGTYRDESQQITVTFKAKRGGYVGKLSFDGQNQVVRAHWVNDQLLGTTTDETGAQISWVGQLQGRTLYVQSHELSLVLHRVASSPSKRRQRKRAKTSRSQKPPSPRPLPSQAFQRIAGSKLYWSRKGRLYRSGSGGYGEIDFCPDGTFRDLSEYSYRAETGHGLAAGAGQHRGSGTWRLQNRNGRGILALQYHTGKTDAFFLDKVLSGSWRNGRIRLAMGWRKAHCP